MNKKSCFLIFLIFVLVLSAGAVCATDYDASPVNSTLGVSGATENVIDALQSSVSNDDVDSFKLSLSYDVLLESDSSNVSSTNTDNSLRKGNSIDEAAITTLSDDVSGYASQNSINDNEILKASVDSNVMDDASLLAKSNINTNISTIYDGENLIATLTDGNGNPISGAKVGFANNGVTYIRTDRNGQAKYSTSGLASGTYTIKIKFYGDDTYSESNQAIVKITVGKLDTILTSADVNVDYGRDAYLVATLKDSNNKAVSGVRVGFANNGVKYLVTDANGQAKYSTKDLDEGSYTVKMKFYGDDKYSASNQAIAKVTVSKITTNLMASDVHVIYHDDDYLVATLTDAGGKAVKGVKVGFANNGVKYFVTDANGQARYPTKDLDEGSYTVKMKFYGDDTYSASNQAIAKIVVGKLATELTSKDILVIHGADSYLIATLKDANGKAVSGVRVGFANNGVKYLVTDANGQAKYSTKDLALGVQTVKMKFYGDSVYAPSNQAISKVIVTNSATKLTWKSGTSFVEGYNNFKILLADKNNIALPGKVVKLTIDSKTYSATTDSNGYVTFNVPLASGSYTASYTFSGDDLHKTSKSKTVITVKKRLDLDDSYGYYLFGADMRNVNLRSLANAGTTDIFLNYYALEKHGQIAVENWIESVNKFGMRVHIWMQAFYEGSWINPIVNGNYNYAHANEKISEAQDYAKIKGISGIHLDYLRYPGNAYATSGGTAAISKFTKSITEEIHKINPNLIVSAAIMPETTVSAYYYGQDYSAISSTVDVVMPMIYKGNYGKSTAWIKTTAKWYADNSKGAKVWTVLQAYKSDDNPVKLPVSELTKDINNALSGGSDGVILFRYGLTNLIDFNNL